MGGFGVRGSGSRKRRVESGAPDHARSSCPALDSPLSALDSLHVLRLRGANAHGAVLVGGLAGIRIKVRVRQAVGLVVVHGYEHLAWPHRVRYKRLRFQPATLRFD